MKRAQDIYKQGGWLSVGPTSRGTWSVTATFIRPNGLLERKRWTGIKERTEIADHVNTDIIRSVREAIDWLEENHGNS